MSTTHHFRIPKMTDRVIFAAFSREVRQYLDSLQADGLTLTGPDGTGRPRCTVSRVSFTGPGDAPHEPVDLRQNYGCNGLHSRVRGHIFDSVKTSKLPYDAAVRGVLVLACVHFGDTFEVQSEAGTEPYAWTKVSLLQVFPHHADAIDRVLP